MSFPRYPKYKDSGVEWLGDLPQHWEIKPLFACAFERDESNRGMLVDNLLSLSYGNIIPKDLMANEGLLPESFETYQIVRRGDIVFRLTDLQNDKRSLRTGLVDEDGIITSAYLAVAPRGPDPRFMAYLCRAYDLTKVFYSMGGGVRQTMKFADMKRLPTILPPLPEQTAIAEFLDRETGKIDELVAEQRRLMELLKEKRQAVISHAVTKGLNPHAPMKPSGIEWLGDVPEHWEVKPLRYVCYCLDGSRIPLNSAQRAEKQGDVPYWGANSIMDYVDEALFDEDLVLLGEDGAPFFDKLKPIAFFSQGRVWPNNHVHVLRPVVTGTAKFITHVLNITDFAHFIDGSTRDKLTQGSMKEIPLPFPPLPEQTAIAEFLDRETGKIDELVAEAQRAIDLLQERRTALISAAVTGQIDVRQHSPQN